MIYFLVALVFLILFLSSQQDRRSSVKFLACTMLSYFFAILFMVLYLSRDVRYYNIISDYFLLPTSLWKSLMFSNLSKDLIIRGMNLFSLLTIFLGCQFSLTYLNQHSDPRRKLLRRLRILLGVFLGAELLIYDPALSKSLYLLLYPAFLNVQQYERMLSGIHTCTVALNCALVAASCLNLILAVRKIRFFPKLRYYTYGEILSYILVMVSFLFLFSTLPTHMVRVSRVSGYTSYISLTLYSSRKIYAAFPYCLLFSSLLMCVCVFAISRFNKKLNEKEFTISGHIDAVNTSSNAFCHYMKNELLAIEAEAQLLEIPEENRPELNHLIERCQNLYGRLDTLHRSTNLSSLTMEHTDLEALIHSMVAQMAPELTQGGYQVSIRRLDSIPSVLLDANYFEQALHNIVTNALDAMKDLPPERRNLTFTIRSIDSWVALSITDTGCGIPQENLSRIFDPFFSSHPIARHWGIGMTVTYQIIQAHNGSISVESQEGKGTTFRILLPNLKKILP